MSGVTVEELAEACGVSLRTARMWCHQGRVRCTRIPRLPYRVYGTPTYGVLGFGRSQDYWTGYVEYRIEEADLQRFLNGEVIVDPDKLSPRRIMTHGNRHNCACPWCGKTLHDVTRGVELPFGQVTLFKRSCPHCSRLIVFDASWDVAVIAETAPEPRPEGP